MPDVDSPSNSRVLPESYWESLSAVYLKEEGGRKDLEAELPELRRILPLVAHGIRGLYRFEEATDRGGAGLISRVVDLNLTKLQEGSEKVYRALKLARPVEARQDLLNVLIAKEFRFLASLTHSNVVKLYYAGVIVDQDVERPFYVMDFIEGRVALTKYVQLPGVALTDFLAVLKDMMTGMAFLFGKNIVHNDIKPSNFLIQDGRGIISDLGSATRQDTDDETTITFTLKYAHPDKIKGAFETRESNRYRKTLRSGDFKIEWDLYSLGLSVLELLDLFASSHGTTGITEYQYKYLRLLGSRLLDGHIRRSGPEGPRPYDFPPVFYDETKYRDIREPLADLAKLTGEYRIETQVPELDFFSGENIQVAMHGQTPISKKLTRVIEHPVFKRLTSISQLGLISYLYPGATHTRGEHSLGTFGNAARMVYALWNDPVNPIFRQLMGPNDITACLLAALLHDVGQYPMAHDLEEADPEFFKHERIGYEFFGEQIEGETSLSETINKLWDTAPPMSERVLAIMHAQTEKHATHPVRARILHGIVDGPIDADKLDYLVRDSVKLKVPYGLMIDFERLSKMLTVIHEKKGDYLSAEIGVHEKGKVSAESVAFARYALFGSIYWHHTSRSVKAMLHYAAWDMLASLPASERAPHRSEFIQVILKNRLPMMQQNMFESQSSASMRQVLWPGINLADLQVLAWLWRSAGKSGKSIVDQLASRQLYKRALTISEQKLKDIWKDASKFSEKATPIDRLALDAALESELLKHLGELTKKQTHETQAFDDVDAKIANVVRARLPIVLVDIPPDRTKTMHDLKFFGETDRWRYYEDDLVLIRVEESQVWEVIRETFASSLGKVRVFVHPDVYDAVRAVPRDVREDMLRNALASYGSFTEGIEQHLTAERAAGSASSGQITQN